MKFSLKMSFFILCFGAFLDWMSYGLVYPIFAAEIFHDSSLLMDTPNILRGIALGGLLAASPLMQFFTAPTVGELSDRFGRKPALQITSLIIVAGYLVSAFGVWIQSLFFLILGRVITGAGASNIAVINSSMADLSHPLDKAKNFALIAMASGIGFVVGPLLGGKLSIWGFAVPFIFAGFLTLGNFFLIIFWFSETHTGKKHDHTLLSFKIGHVLRISFLKKFRFIFLSFFVFCFGWSFYWEFIPVTWIKHYGIDVSQIGDFYAYGSVFYVVSSGLLIRPILKKFKGLTVLLVSLAALGFFLISLLGAKLMLYWFYIPIQQFLVALIFPVGTAIVSNLATQDQQGEILGAFQSLQSLAFALTPLLGGVLIGMDYKITLILSGVSMFLACLILVMRFFNTQPKKRRVH